MKNNYKYSARFIGELAESLPIAYCIVRLNDGHPSGAEVIEANPAFANMLRDGADKIKGKKLVEIFPQSHPYSERVPEIIENLKNHGNPAPDPNMDIRLLEDNIAVIYFRNINGDGECDEEKKSAELELRRKSEELELLINNIKTQIWFMRDAETCGKVNRSHARFFGLNPTEIEGRKLFEFMPDEEAEKCVSTNQYIWRTKSTYTKEEIVTNGQREKKYLVVNKFPKLDSAGNVEYLVCSAEDITELKHKQEEMKQIIVALKLSNEITEQRSMEILKLNKKLEQSEAKLKELNANKDKFFSIIAHDLKNPFQGFLGLSKMLLKDINNNAPRQELVELTDAMHTSAQHLFKLLENLLQWSRLQRGVVDFNPGDYPLMDIVFSNIDIFSNNMKEKNIRLATDVAEKVYVNVDINMINTVMRNLLSNAIKFTPEGGEIKIFTEEYSTDFILVGIADSGVGIAQENLDKLFRISEGYTTEGTGGEQGTGLGLILCRELIDRHHAKIWAESEPGKGSTFYFTLPLAPLGEYSLGNEIA
jgi:PAS domain S-box-containing protein